MTVPALAALLLWVWPTAQAFRADVTATAYRLAPPAVGLGTGRQAVPFQRKMTGLGVWLVVAPV
jgi:hypothetical protein